MKIALFGDSIGRGVVYDPEKQRYIPTPNSFAKLLTERDGVEVDNFSRFGCRVTKGVELVTRHADKLKDYDYIFLMYGGNDTDYDWPAVADSPDSFHDSQTPMPQFESAWTELIELVEKNGGRPVMLSMAPIDVDKYFSWISAKSDGNAILRFLGSLGMIYRWNDMYNLALERIAQLFNLPFIDIRSPMLGSRSFDKVLCVDGIHPTELGQEMIYNRVIDWLREQPAFSPS